MLSRKTGRRRPRGENNGYWMSYSDMMAALLLMFVLLLFLSFTRYMALRETKEAELSAKEEQLLRQEHQLSQAQLALLTREQELSTVRTVLNAQQLTLDEQQMEIDEKSRALEKSGKDLEESLAQLILQQKKIEDQEALLALSEAEVEEARRQLTLAAEDLEDRERLLSAKDAALLTEQLRVGDLETQLGTQKEQLDEQAARIDALVGVRSRIVEQLRDAFAQEGLNVKVDVQTGAITMDSTVFFDSSRATLKEEGRQLLSRFLPVYFRTLMQPENAEYVAEIIVEGHTDSDGSYALNLDLSQKRAQAVVTYCLGETFTELTEAEKDTLRGMITANGRSKSQLIYDAYGMEDKAASRRVEIKFRLKDAEMIESLSRILAEMDLGGT